MMVSSSRITPIATTAIVIMLIAVSFWNPALAYRTGAGRCVSEEASVGFPHTVAGSTTGSLEDGGLELVVDDTVVVSTSGSVSMTAGANHTIVVRSSNNSGTSSAGFRGALIRVLSPTANGSGSQLILEPGANAQATEECEAPAAGVTHTSSDNKTEFGASLTLEADASGSVSMDVTIVVSNNFADGSFYYYSSYDFVIEPDDNGSIGTPTTTTPPSNNGTVTSAPAAPSTPTAPAPPTSSAAAAGAILIASTAHSLSILALVASAMLGILL